MNVFEMRCTPIDYNVVIFNLKDVFKITINKKLKN